MTFHYFRARKFNIFYLDVRPIVFGLSDNVFKVWRNHPDIKEWSREVNLRTINKIDNYNFVVVEHISSPSQSDCKLFPILWEEWKRLIVFSKVNIRELRFIKLDLLNWFKCRLIQLCKIYSKDFNCIHIFFIVWTQDS